jgi:hypothetical protein
MPRLIHLDKMPSRTTPPERGELPPWDPGGSALAILRLLYRYRYLTSELLGMVYEHEQGRGASQVRHHLTQLWRYGYVLRFYRPAERGSTQYVYALSVEGAHLVVPDEDWPVERRRVYNRARGRRDYEHLLAVSLLQVLWDLGSPQFDELFRTVAYWVDKDGDAEHVRNSFTVQLERERGTVRPDTTVLIAHRARGYYRPVFFEIERTHKNLDRTRQRFRIYDELLTKQHAAAAAVFKREVGKVPEKGMAVFVAGNWRHAEALRQVARNTLGLDERGKKTTPDMWFTSLEEFFVERDGREEILPPPALFERPIAVNLAGVRGRLVV